MLIVDWRVWRLQAELTVSHIIVERHVFAARLEGSGVLDHFHVESVEVFVRDGIVDDYDSVFVEASYGFLQVAWT
jgi:hypothetical protein